MMVTVTIDAVCLREASVEFVVCSELWPADSLVFCCVWNVSRAGSCKCGIMPKAPRQVFLNFQAADFLVYIRGRCLKGRAFMYVWTISLMIILIRKHSVGLRHNPQALGPELIHYLGSQSSHEPAVGCHYFPLGQRLPSQPKNVTALWPVPNYTAWLQRRMRVNNLPMVITWKLNRRYSNPRPLDRAEIGYG